MLACVPRVGTAADARVVVRSGTAWLETGVTSLRALRDAGVVKQRYDYSCGAASLATLLTYGLNDRVDEDGLLRATPRRIDRKSTRLNSSHRCISYAVFCLKKKIDNTN